MRIGTPPPPGVITLAPRTAASLSLQPGQSVTALVTATADGRVSLDMAGRLIEARTTLTLLTGQLLRLRVESDGARLLLRLTAPPAEPALTRALRSALPRQMPLGEAFSRLAAADAKPPPSLPDPVRTALREAVAATIERTAVTRPESLRQAIAAAGPFLEARLLAGAAVDGDMKAVLLRLAATLLRQQTARKASPEPQRPTPTPAPAARAPTGAATVLARGPEGWFEALFKAAEGALARVQTHQARAAVANERGEEPTVTVELPLRDADQSADALLLRIRRQRGTAGDRDSWSVTLEFDGGTDGPVRARVTWSDDAVSTTFWAESPPTTDRFRAALPQLAARLAAAGLTVGNLAALTGEPPDTEPPLPRGLLNERA